MKIRFACREDIPGIIDLLRQVGQVHHQGRPDLFRQGAQKYNEAQVEAMLGKEEDPIFVAVEKGAVLGYGFCMLQKHRGDTVLADFSTLYIDDICVDENCRGKHVGSAIYRHICAYAKEVLGCQSITLNVWCCNPGAMAFYESLGMKPQKIGMEQLLEG